MLKLILVNYHLKPKTHNKRQQTPGANRASNNKTVEKSDKIAAEKRRNSSEDMQKEMVDLSIINSIGTSATKAKAYIESNNHI